MQGVLVLAATVAMPIASAIPRDNPFSLEPVLQRTG
jgi:hypothetical protein